MSARSLGIKHIRRTTVSVAALAALTAVCLSACRTVPLTAVNAALWATPGRATIEEIDQAIWRAGRKEGWQMEILRPGELRGTWRKSHHELVVAIGHDGRDLSVRHLSSTNLKEGGGKIHRAYHRLLERLVERIRRELVAVAHTRPRDSSADRARQQTPPRAGESPRPV